MAESEEAASGAPELEWNRIRQLRHILRAVRPARLRSPAAVSGRKSSGAAEVLHAPSVRRSHQQTNHRLSLKVLCGAGAACLYHCGGRIPTPDGARGQAGSEKAERWEFFLGDAAFAPHLDQAGRRQTIAQIAGIEHHAAPGDVVISNEMLGYLTGVEVKAERLDDRAVRLQAMHVTPAQEAALRVLPPPGPQQLPSHVAARAAALFRMHVVENVRQRIEAGQYDFINEIRPLTILFMGFPTLLEPDASLAYRLEPVQDTVTSVTRVMQELQGSFVQFRCDEKGFLAICAFGLPGSSHANSAERGVLAALRMQEAIEQQGQRIACGVTTGNLLCACVGSKLRSEYTMFGDAINLSARLMCKAKAGLGTVLTDEPTYQKASSWATFNALQPMALKGKAQPAKASTVLVSPRSCAQRSQPSRERECQ